MKISLYTISLNGGYYDGPAVPLLDIFPLARKWGYDGVEIEAKRPHGNPMDLSAKDRTAIRKAAKANGLEISCVASYNDFSSPVDEHRENELLMVREQIRLAAELGSPIVRVFAFWSGVTRRNGRITYDLARRNIEDRFPGTTPLELWCNVRECLVEAVGMAKKAGVTLVLQNHKPIVNTYRHMLDFIEEVNSPVLKACLDSPLMECHSEDYYRQAIRDTGKRLAFTHFGGRFRQGAKGRIERDRSAYMPYPADDAAFFKAAKEIVDYQGHIGYELCSPVLTGHRFEGLKYALQQSAFACRYMRQVIDAT